MINEPDLQADIPEFSLVKGGLVYRFFRWTDLCDEDLEPAFRRCLVFAAITWVPLFLISFFEGHAFFSGSGIPFFRDITVHARFLVALPALLAAETAAQELIGPRIKEFLTRKIIRPDDLPRFKAAIESAHRMRDSVVVEAGLMILVYSLGLWIWRSQIASESPSWYAAPDGTNLNLTLAGYWLILVCVPIFQFLLIRWYYRFVIWFIFLLRVSRLNMNLVATHSDRSAGIGFLAQCAYGFTGVLFAQGVLTSASIANEALHAGRNVVDYKMETVAVVLFFLAVVLVPLTVFSPALVKAKWHALVIYGALASKYVEGFDNKWIGGENPDREALLGTGDIQSLADLSNSFAVLQSMRPVPFELKDVLWLAGTTAIPLLPLAFFVFSLNELIEKLVQVLV